MSKPASSHHSIAGSRAHSAIQSQFAQVAVISQQQPTQRSRPPTSSERATSPNAAAALVKPPSLMKPVQQVTTRQFDAMVRRREQEQQILAKLKQRRSELTRDGAFATQSLLQDCDMAIEDAELAIADMLRTESECEVITASDDQSLGMRSRTSSVDQLSHSRRTSHDSNNYGDGKFQMLTQQLAQLRQQVDNALRSADEQPSLELLRLRQQLDEMSQMHVGEEYDAEMAQAAKDHSRKVVKMRFLKEELELQKEVAKLQAELALFGVTAVAGMARAKTPGARIVTPARASRAQTEGNVRQPRPSVKDTAWQVNLYVDFISIIQDLLFSTSVVTVKIMHVVGSSQVGDTQELVSHKRVSLGIDRYQLLFPEHATFKLKPTVDTRIYVSVEVTEGGGISDSIGWTQLNLVNAGNQFCKGYWRLECLPEPVMMSMPISEFTKQKHLTDLVLFARMFESSNVAELNVDPHLMPIDKYQPRHSSVNLQQQAAAQSPEASPTARSRKNIDRSEQSVVVSDRNKFKSMKAIGGKTTQMAGTAIPAKSTMALGNSDKAMVFLARSMKTLGPKTMSFKLAVEKLHDLYEVCTHLRLQVHDGNDVRKLDDLPLKVNKTTLQLKEKAEVECDDIAITESAYIQFVMVGADDKDLCWGRVYLFDSKSDQLVLCTGIVDIVVFPMPVDQLAPVAIINAGVWVKLSENDVQGRAMLTAQGLTPLPADVWLPVKTEYDLSNMFFEDSSGFAVCIDGARYLMPNVRASRVTAQLYSQQYEPLKGCQKIESKSDDLECDCQLPVYQATGLFPSMVDRTATILIKVTAMDSDGQLYNYGFSVFNPYVETASLQQPSSGSGMSRLNTGAYQIPIYQGRVDVLKPLNVQSSVSYTPIPCSTLLVRIVPLTELTQDFPLYSSATYDSTRCVPSELEGQLYLQMQRDRQIITYGMHASDMRKRGQIGIGSSEQEALEWFNYAFTKPQLKSPVKQLSDWDYAPLVQYSGIHGLAVSVDGLQNVPSKLAKSVPMVIASITPLCRLYSKSGPALSIENSRYTAQLKVESALRSPMFTDGWWKFQPLEEDAKIVFDVKSVSTASDNIESVGWTALPLTNGHGFSMHGNFQLPLYQGVPTAAALKHLKNQSNQLKLVEGASLFVRVCDARRVEFLSLAATIVVSYLPQRDMKAYMQIKSSGTVKSQLMSSTTTAQQFMLPVVTRLKNYIYNGGIPVSL